MSIAKVVKEHSQNMLWAQEQGSIGLDELDDITFIKAADDASKDQKVHHYLGDGFRRSSNRAARHLREMFREEREFEGGKISKSVGDILSVATILFEAIAKFVHVKETERQRSISNKAPELCCRFIHAIAISMIADAIKEFFGSFSDFNLVTFKFTPKCFLRG